jgi:hypothetical protein
MIELISASVGLADKIMDTVRVELQSRYKRRFYRVKRKLEKEYKKPPHERIDGTIDDLHDELVLLLNSFGKEIGA